MPIFEYRCLKCDSEFEKLVFGSPENGIACPDCRSDAVEQLFSSFNGVSKSGDGSSRPMSSGCSSCHSSSCSSCKSA